jgi:uroporphyrinogen decarboxylase
MPTGKQQQQKNLYMNEQAKGLHHRAGRKALIDVLEGRVPSRRPIWLMRQAGRYLPEYLATRMKAGSFLDLCYTPELAAEVTLQPLRRFDLDAAIVFADILLVPHALGVAVTFQAGEGPLVEMVADARRVEQLAASPLAREIEAVYETVRQVRARLASDVALIGFCGAPWTVATYLIEGGSSAERMTARLAAFREERWLEALIDALVGASIEYLAGQVAAGADCVQIFDSWAVDLPDGLRQRFCLAPIRRIIEGLRVKCGAVPVIGFARGLGAAHAEFVEATGVQACGIESGVPLGWAARVLAPAVAVQGNLDPASLLAGGAGLERDVTRIVTALPYERHVFNLGHGIRPQTDPREVVRLVETVRRVDGSR